MTEPAPPAAQPYVFLSYASVDRERALQIADAIERAGIPVWIDRQAITGGTSWSAEIVDGIMGCAAFVVLGSAHAFASPNVQRELNLAVEENRPLLPLLLDRAVQPREVRYALAGRQWIEVLDRPPEDWLPAVLQALARLAVGPRPPAIAPNRPMAVATDFPLETSVHIPTPLTSFIGREQELAEVTDLLGTTRLLTLTGPGGTGKTRLALATAAHVTGRYLHGVWFVDLSGVTDPAGVLPAIAQALEVREGEGCSLAVSLVAYLRRKQLLLVLDNLEQVVSAAMALYDLLAEAPGLSLLVTSRSLLHVGGEQEYAVPPLPPPQADVQDDPAMLQANPAVQLFLDRAHALRPGLVVTEEALRAVGTICARLDGLPLAIELAAARVKMLSPVQLLARLERRLPLLTGGVRSLPARQQTLRATIAWSWDLLSEAEGVLLRRLAVFAGGFTLAAAEAVCNAEGELDVLEGLAALVDQSLVRQAEIEGEPRFSLLATLQEFALERLESAREVQALRLVHATYFATLAEGADEANWRRGRTRHDVIRPLDPERDNMIAALGWALTEQDAALGLRLGAALGTWFYFRAPGEGQEWLARVLSVGGGSTRCAARPCPARCRFLRLCARRVGGSSLTLGGSGGLFAGGSGAARLSITLALLCAVLPVAANERALTVAEEALRLAQAAGGVFTVAFAEAAVGLAQLFHGGNRAEARGHLEEALRLALALGADWLPMFALSNLAVLAEAEGQNKRAIMLWHEVLPLAEAVGDRYGTVRPLMQLAQLAEAESDQDEAAVRWRSALAVAQELSSAAITAFCLAGIAGLVSAQQRPERAVRLLAASERLRETIEQHPGIGSQFQAASARARSATEASLRPEAFARAWAAGQALSLDEATDLALTELVTAAS